jgi:CDP-diacylglycerol--serine O-phosphatidyltransferase
MASDKIRLFTVPNLITCLNLLSGCVGIVVALAGKLEVAMVCVLLSAVFDFLDGFAARLLKSYSAVGVQLDSLADMVSFGVLPALMLVCAMFNEYAPVQMSITLKYVLCCSPFILTVFSALRLAKFNVDTRQTESFLGLPTPANALFFASLVILFEGRVGCKVALPLIAAFSFLMVSEIPMFSLKIKSFSVRKSSFQLLSFLVFSASIAAGLLLQGVPLLAIFAPIMLLYIIPNLVKWAFTKGKQIINNHNVN